MSTLWQRFRWWLWRVLLPLRRCKGDPEKKWKRWRPGMPLPRFHPLELITAYKLNALAWTVNAALDRRVMRDNWGLGERAPDEKDFNSVVDALN